MRVSKWHVLAFCTLALLCSSCATHYDPRYSGGRSPEQVAADLEKKRVVTYYDRNGDGRVDYEVHEIPRMADDGWALRDNDFDGRYDLRYDFAYTYPPITGPSHIDIPVPSHVHITRGKPADGFAGDPPLHQ